MCPPRHYYLASIYNKVALQGIATGAAYLGSFCLMLRMAPDNEQANKEIA